jgi:outer membrane protein OmpA-like peptidoglycan-associated protein
MKRIVFYLAFGINCVFSSVLFASTIKWDIQNQTYTLCDVCPVSHGLKEKLDIPLSIKTSFVPADIADSKPSRKEVVYFERGSSALSKKDQEKVQRVAQNGGTIYSVRGYASEDGDPDTNGNLSLKRADTIADIFRRYGHEIKNLDGEIEWGMEPYCFSRKAEIHYGP